MFGNWGCEVRKYFKVIVTKEYVVESDTEQDALSCYESSSVWSDESVDSYELFDSDLPKYGINQP